MKSKKNSINQLIDQELEKHISLLINDKLKNYDFNKAILRIADKSMEASMRQMMQLALNPMQNKTQENFYNPVNQVLGTLSSELQKAIMRNL